MLKLNLAALDRDEVRLREEIAADDPMWEGSGVNLVEPLEVDLTARSVGDGVLLRGRLRATVERECRRCLAAVTQVVDDTVDMLFAPIGEDEEELGGEVYPLPERGQELDVGEAVREQLLLPAARHPRTARAAGSPRSLRRRRRGVGVVMVSSGEWVPYGTAAGSPPSIPHGAAPRAARQRSIATPRVRSRQLRGGDRARPPPACLGRGLVESAVASQAQPWPGSGESANLLRWTARRACS